MASHDSSPKYAHKPLTSPRSFRVLKLLPSLDFYNPISCEIREASLDDRVKYEALSYVWGEERGYAILIGIEELSVTWNCLAALMHLRRKFRCRVLWVDAICIDQRESQPSVRERNHQVELMGKIYAEAHTVLVWLGLSEPSTVRSIRRLKQMGYMKVLPSKPLQRRLCMPLVEIWPTRLGYSLKHRAIEGILWDDWWYRAWTFQEQTLARRCVILQGRKSISMSDLMKAILSASVWEPTATRLLGYSPQTAFASQNRLSYETYKLQEATRSVHNPRLITKALLTGAIFMDATLRVDSIYALYYMLVTHGLPLPEPDYNKAYEVVYEETVWAWINQWQDLSILQTAARATHVQNLPSWVPAYHIRINHHEERLAFNDYSWDYIRNEDNPYTGHAGARHVPKMLKVKGRYIGKVTHDYRDLTWHFAEGTGAIYWRDLCMYLFDNSSRESLGYDGMLRELFEILVFPRGSEYINDDNFSAFKRWFDYREFVTKVFPCSLYILENGMLGKANPWCEVGDEAFLLRGADCPFVLRRDGENYRLVGPAYFYRLDQKQLWRFDGDDVRDITLV